MSTIAFPTESKKFSVLCFDDEKNFTKNIATHLRSDKRFSQVETVNTIKELKEIVNRRLHDAYLVDICVGDDIDPVGVNLAKFIRDKSKNAYISFVTAYPNYGHNFKSYGVNSCFDKPIDHMEFPHNLIEQLEAHYLTARQEKYRFINTTAKLLKDNPDIKNIIINIFGQEVPSLAEHIDEIENIYHLSDEYIASADDLIESGNELLMHITKEN